MKEGTVFERLQFLVLTRMSWSRNCLGVPKTFGTRMSEKIVPSFVCAERQEIYELC